MSRIGKAPISLPQGVELKVSKGNMVSVKGPKGELQLQVDPDLDLKTEDSELVISRPTEQKRHKAMHGLYRSLLQNLVDGVTEGYSMQLELVGVGYRAQNAGQLLELTLGYSHPIYFMIPEEVVVETITQKGANPIVKLDSIDKQLIGQVAAKIRALRPPEPYKGKGVRFLGENIRRKAGKTAGK